MRAAPRRLQRGFLLNSHRFGGGGGGSWNTAFDLGASPGGSSLHALGSTTRQVIPASVVISGTKARLTLRGGSSGNYGVDAAYLQHAAASGDAYDFSSTPVQVTVGGSASFSVPQGGQVVTDEIIVAITAGVRLIYSQHISVQAIAGVYNSGTTGYDPYSKASVNEAATVDVTGYSTAGGGNTCKSVRKLEIFS